MMTSLMKQFGTKDFEWFCASEAILNTIFNLKSVDSHEYAKIFIENIGRKLYVLPKDDDSNPLDDINQSQINGAANNVDKLPLRKDLTELHYA